MVKSLPQSLWVSYISSYRLSLLNYSNKNLNSYILVNSYSFTAYLPMEITVWFSQAFAFYDSAKGVEFAECWIFQVKEKKKIPLDLFYRQPSIAIFSLFFYSN